MRLPGNSRGILFGFWDCSTVILRGSQRDPVGNARGILCGFHWGSEGILEWRYGELRGILKRFDGDSKRVL